MTNSITFKEMVKLIHPDLNPDLKDHAEMMIKAKIYREHERFLYKLGVKWGVIGIKPKPVKKVTRTPPNRSWVDSQSMFSVGRDIFIITKRVYATVVKTTSKRVYYRSSTGQESFVLKKNARVL